MMIFVIMVSVMIIIMSIIVATIMMIMMVIIMTVFIMMMISRTTERLGFESRPNVGKLDSGLLLTGFTS